MKFSFINFQEIFLKLFGSFNLIENLKSNDYNELRVGIKIKMENIMLINRGYLGVDLQQNKLWFYIHIKERTAQKIDYKLDIKCLKDSIPKYLAS